MSSNLVNVKLTINKDTTVDLILSSKDSITLLDSIKLMQTKIKEPKRSKEYSWYEWNALRQQSIDFDFNIVVECTEFKF